MTFPFSIFPRVLRARSGVLARRLAVAGTLALMGLGLGAATPQAAVFNPQTFTLANGLQVVVIGVHRLPVVRQIVF